MTIQTRAQAGVAGYPTEHEMRLATEANECLGRHLMIEHGSIRLNVIDRDSVTCTVEVPPLAMRMFVEILEYMSRGQTVTLFPVYAELSTQEAADLLNVSRPHVVKLLEQGAIPHHKTGSHRRIRIEDLMAYRLKVGSGRRAVLDQLAAHGQAIDPEY